MVDKIFCIYRRNYSFLIESYQLPIIFNKPAQSWWLKNTKTEKTIGKKLKNA